MVEMMILHRYVKDNISVLHKNTTLLKSSQLFFEINKEDAIQTGAYLYYDSNKNIDL